MGVTANGSRFEGAVALITGASRGIGLSVAQRLVSEGARVCVTARTPEPLREVAAELGGDQVALAVPGHVADADHARQAVEAAVEHFGRLDVLVNNAGVSPIFGPLLDTTQAAADKMARVNVLAHLNFIRPAQEALREYGGAVVNIASVTGLRPAHGIGWYGITKAGVVQLTAQLAHELAPEVRVNGVAPGVVRTKFALPLFEGRESEVAAMYPLGRIGEPADVAAAVCFLASPEAAWITGQTLTVDGGLLLGGGV